MNMKKLYIFMFLLLILPMVRITIYASDIVIQNYTSFLDVNENFLRDEVIITLTNVETQLGKKYNNNDFPEIDCISVDELTYPCIDNPDFKRIFKITLANNGTEYILDAINKLSMRDEIFFVGPNYRYNLINSNEEFCNDNGMLRSNIQTVDKEWGLKKIKGDVAQDMFESISIEGTPVGIIEAGIDSGHTALNNFDTNLSENFITNVTDYSSDPFVDEGGGHGTKIAGIINAFGYQSQMVGVSPLTPVVSLKGRMVLSGNPSLPSSYDCDEIISAIEYARYNGISILNCSFGEPFEDTNLLSAMSQYDGLIVCSAGNSYKNLDDTPIFPACFELDNIITVGSMNINDEIWYGQEIIEGEPYIYGSNYGLDCVDVFAPGVDIYTTSLNNSYAYDSGTSFAAPYVSALASMIASLYEYKYYEEISAQELKSIIINNVNIVDGFEDYCVSSGYINAEKCFNYIHFFGNSYQYMDYNINYHLVCPTYGYDYYEEHSWVWFNGWTSPFAIRPSNWICEKCQRVKLS